MECEELLVYCFGSASTVVLMNSQEAASPLDNRSMYSSSKANNLLI